MSQVLHLDDVISRVEKLLARQKQLEAENHSLREENEQLKKDLGEKVAALATAGKRLETMKFASVVDSREDRTALKARINEYIKEIDRCIVFLSK